MRTVLFLLLICWACAGCQVNPRTERQIALLRAEILDLEDQYYLLKSQRDSAVAQLRGCEGTDFDATQFDGSLLLDGGRFDDSSESDIWDDAPSDIIYESPADSRTDPRSGRQPGLDVPNQNDRNGSGSGSRIENQPRLEEVVPDDGAFNSSTQFRDNLSSRDSSNANGEVSQIVISRNVSGGQDLDGSPGHEGLALLIQPLDRSGRIQKQAGQLTVRVVERKPVASDRQIGLWQFTSQETESFLVKDGEPEQGILLHLPWNKQLPQGRSLTVFVSYLTNDRRQLETVLDFVIEPPPANYSPDNPLVAEWIERDSRWNEIDVSGNSLNSLQSRDNPSETDNPLSVESATTENGVAIPQWRPVR